MTRSDFWNGWRRALGTGKSSAWNARLSELPLVSQVAARLAAPLGRPVLYPIAYQWFVLLAALDVLFTWGVLRIGGWEVNGIARAVIHHGDVAGMITLKFFTVVVVLLICEYIGRRRLKTGLGLSIAAVALNVVPVTVGASHLMIFAVTRIQVGHVAEADYELAMAHLMGAPEP
jgi:hypothetical protein